MKVYAMLANGFEIAEATLPIDILRRAGIQTVTVSITDEDVVTASNGIPVIADQVLPASDLLDGDMIFLPGGMPGSTNLSQCAALADYINEYNAAGKYLAAVCAAPMVYGLMGLLQGKKATCYPGFEEKLLGAEFQKKSCILDGNIITACGAGVGYQLGHQMVTVLAGKEVADTVLQKMMYQVYE